MLAGMAVLLANGTEAAGEALHGVAEQAAEFAGIVAVEVAAAADGSAVSGSEAVTVDGGIDVHRREGHATAFRGDGAV